MARLAMHVYIECNVSWYVEPLGLLRLVEPIVSVTSSCHVHGPLIILMCCMLEI